MSQGLTGSYIYTDPAGHSSLLLEFQKNRFYQTSYSDIDSTKGQGYYIIDQNRLILFFETINNSDTSFYTIKDKKELQNSTLSSFDISVFKSQQNPIEGAFVSLLTGSEVIATMFTDYNGNIQFMIDDPETVTYVRISFFGYHSLNIPTKQFIRNSIHLECTLKPKTVNLIGEKRIDYTIVTASDKFLKIRNEHGVLTLEKCAKKK